jgi:hypothetical protein
MSMPAEVLNRQLPQLYDPPHKDASGEAASKGKEVVEQRGGGNLLVGLEIPELGATDDLDVRAGSWPIARNDLGASPAAEAHLLNFGRWARVQF